jgi:hypothetical protein
MFEYKEDILKIIYKQDNTINASKVKDSYFKKYYSEIFEDINNTISSDYPFNQKILLYLEEKTHIEKCLNCNKEDVKYSGKFKTGFNKFCSKKCSNEYNAEFTSENRIKKYGYYYSNKDKAKQTMLEKYGDVNYNNRESAFKTMTERYGAKTTGESEILSNKTKKTNLEKYGTEYAIGSDIVKSKIENSFIEKYGVDKIGKSELIRERIKNTLLERYNTTDLSKIDGNLEKRINTNLKKYGVSHGFQSENVKDKIKNTLLEKYGVEHPLKSKDIKNKVKEKYNNNFINKYLEKGIELEVINEDEVKVKNYCNIHNEFIINKNNLNLRHFRYKVDICTKCNPISNNTSSYENEIKKYLDSKNISYIEKDRKILNGNEIDILIPDFNFGIEFNGSYYHSDKFKDKNYHLNKTNLAIIKGYNIFHVHESDFVNKRDLIYSMINSKLNIINTKIFARKCIIKTIDRNIEKEFLNENHIQGYAVSIIAYGLYYKNELVSLMSFSKKRIISKHKNNLDGEYELLRFCNKINHTVIGGASKLLRKFEKDFNPDIIYSYANRDYSNGNLYYNLGFDFESFTEPSYFWEKNNVKYNRFSLRKDLLVKMGFDKNKTEYEILTEQYYNKIYTTGNLKFIKKYEKYN